MSVSQPKIGFISPEKEQIWGLNSERSSLRSSPHDGMLEEGGTEGETKGRTERWIEKNTEII